MESVTPGQRTRPNYGHPHAVACLRRKRGGRRSTTKLPTLNWRAWAPCGYGTTGVGVSTQIPRCTLTGAIPDPLPDIIETYNRECLSIDVAF